jgi:ABC-type Na+ efflux pump permease subunit
MFIMLFLIAFIIVGVCIVDSIKVKEEKERRIKNVTDKFRRS